MTVDLVVRLRAYPRCVRPHGDTELMQEAANEIEWLRREVSTLRGDRQIAWPEGWHL